MSCTPLRAAFVVLLTSWGLSSLGAGRAGASPIFAGTKGFGSTAGQVLRYAGGTSWEDVTPVFADADGDGFPDAEVMSVWDLESFEGDLVACGEIRRRAGFVARLDVSTGAWTTWTPPAGTDGFPMTALAVMGGKLYACSMVWVYALEPTGWTIVGPSHVASRMTADPCSPAPLLYVGSNLEDDFVWYDPSGSTSCAAACPATAPPMCAGGCFGGSCIHSMAMHDAGSGPVAHAGAFGGMTYVWDPSSNRFVHGPGLLVLSSGGGNVQALASWGGALHAGTSEGGVYALSASGAAWLPVWSFPTDEPVAALEADDDTGLLWVGCGGVPYALGRPDGLARVRTWDGTSVVERGGPWPRAGGVMAIEALAAVWTSCDAGPDQVAECAGSATSVHLSGAATLSTPCSATAPALTWSGGFLETTAPGPDADVTFPGPGDWLVTLTARAGAASTSCDATIHVRDTIAPLVVAPPLLSLDCSDAVPADAAAVSDGCDPAPGVAFGERREDGPCPQSYALVRTWTATDASGNSASASRRIEVWDHAPPALSGVPADSVVDCSAVPAPASPAAADACDPSPSVAMSQARTDGPCSDTYTLTRTWTATDACGNASSATQVLSVRDVVAPALAGVPGDVTVACDAVPAPASPSASDDCDPAPSISMSQTRADGPCSDTHTLTRTWTATDACGNATSATQVLSVRDVVAPALSGVPADVTVPCTAVPAPARPSASDDCDPAPSIALHQARTDGPCPGTYVLRRTWTATDRCGNAARATQSVTVEDREPPRVAGGTGELACLWPPNHRMVTFDRSAFRVVAADDCSAPVTWRLAGCASSQEDDGRGDGSFAGDCVVNPDGSEISVRAERSGRDRAERRYGIQVTASDACGNESAAVLIGFIVVPHDFRAGCVGAR